MAAIITATSFQSRTGLTVTGADLTALASICSGVDAVIRRLIYPFHVEPVTITDHIMDAPNDEVLILPVLPVRSITSIYLRHDANGLAANFTSDYLLDNSEGTEYWLKIDRPIDGYSRNGHVYRRVGSGGWWGGAGSTWGGEGYYPSRRSLAGAVRPGRGAIKMTYAAGTMSVPEEVIEAAKSAALLLYDRRKNGAPFASESWNGRSQSIAGPFSAESAVRNPDVLAMLHYFLPGVHVAGD